MIWAQHKSVQNRDEKKKGGAYFKLILKIRSQEHCQVMRDNSKWTFQLIQGARMLFTTGQKQRGERAGGERNRAISRPLPSHLTSTAHVNALFNVSANRIRIVMRVLKSLKQFGNSKKHPIFDFFSSLNLPKQIEQSA